MSPMTRRHVSVGSGVAAVLTAPGMARHAAAIDEDLDHRGADADVRPLADELVWNAVVGLDLAHDVRDRARALEAAQRRDHAEGAGPIAALGDLHVGAAAGRGEGAR